MARSLGVLLATTVGIAMLAACGGFAAPAATDAASATVGVGGQSPGPGATTTGGSGLDDPCALLTPDEVAGATASDPVTASGTPGDPASCAYRLADGTEVLHLDVIRSGAAAHFQTFVDAGSGESVDGVGDRAYYETGTRRLLVMTGESLVMYLQATSGAQAWGGFEASLTTEPVTGLGDKAMFEPSTGILFVLAGDSIFNVNVFGVSPADALELDRRLAEVMLGHL